MKHGEKHMSLASKSLIIAAVALGSIACNKSTETTQTTQTDSFEPKAICTSVAT